MPSPRGRYTSQVDDQRSGRKRGSRVAVGGGVGIIGLLLCLLLSQLGGSPDSPLPSGLPRLGAGQSANDTQISESCQYGRDANTALDCEVVAVVNSLDSYWTDAFARYGQTYRKPRINFFNGGVNSGCGSASSDVGPFYCPADVDAALDTAARIGDDFIQSELSGRVDEGQFTHGTSEQRQKWYLTGYQSGNPTSCDTFDTRELG